MSKARSGAWVVIAAYDEARSIRRVLAELASLPYRVVVVEKDRGMVRFNQALPNSADFQTVQIDWKNGTIDLCRYDLRVRIAPEPEQKRAGP